MTIKDLAAQTGYSVGTVSRVLNNQTHVSEQARDAIMKAVNASGFKLNANARQLKQQQSNSILVVCKGRSNEMFEALLVLIQSWVAGTDYPLIIDCIDESENVVLRALELLPEKKPLGILFLGGNREEFLEDFHRITVPCVLVTGHGEDLPFENLSSVASDDYQAAQLAIDHLARLGHRQIAVLGGNLDQSEIARQRYNGCLQAFRSNGIDFDETRDYAAARFTYEDAYRAARELLRRNENFTALFAMSDVMAIGAIRSLRDAGKRIPEDISVIGVDGLMIGEYMVPRLSTVSQSVEALANRSIDLLLKAIQKKSGGIHERVPVTLEHKESAKAV